MRPARKRTQDTAALLRYHGVALQMCLGNALTIEQIEAETQRAQIMLPLDLAELYQEADGFSLVFSHNGVSSRIEIWPLQRLYQNNEEIVFAEAFHGRFALTRKGVFLRPIYQKSAVFVAQSAASFVDLMFEHFGIDGWYFGPDEMPTRHLYLMLELQLSARSSEKALKY